MTGRNIFWALVVFLFTYFVGFWFIQAYVEDALRRTDAAGAWFFLYPLMYVLAIVSVKEKKPKPRTREFILRAFSLNWGQGFIRHHERFEFEPFVCNVPEDLPRFWISMEDTGQLEALLGTSAIEVRPRLYTDISEMEQFDQQDVIQVDITNGVVSAKYIGPSDVNASIVWTSLIITGDGNLVGIQPGYSK